MIYKLKAEEPEIMRVSREMWVDVFKERIRGSVGLSGASQGIERLVYEALLQKHWIDFCLRN